MNEAANELSLIRKYLLGGLKGEEREQLEERVLLDPEFKNRVLIAEEDLIEEYAEGRLAGEERRDFQRMFYANPQRCLDVQVVEGLQQRAGAGWTRFLGTARNKLRSKRVARTSTAAPTSVAPLASFLGFRKAAIALAVIVTVIFAFFIFQRYWRPDQTNPSITQDPSRRNHIEQELARLNRRESQSPPLATVTTLSPGLSRGEQQGSTQFPTVTLARDTEVAQLKLLLRPSANDYRSFQAVLTPVGSRESYNVDLLRVESTDAPALVLTLPANALDDGDYRVQLNGQTAAGLTEALLDHYYYFRLTRQ